LRGVTGYGPIRDSDVMLLRHELHEMKLKLLPGMTHDKAHEAAHRKYPWADMVKQSTRGHGSSQETPASKTSPGAVGAVKSTRKRRRGSTVQGETTRIVRRRSVRDDTTTAGTTTAGTVTAARDGVRIRIDAHYFDESGQPSDDVSFDSRAG